MSSWATGPRAKPRRTAGVLPSSHGRWVTSPEALYGIAEPMWKAGYAIHVHTSADLGLDLVLDTLARLQDIRPRFGHKFVVEHFGVSTPEQVERLAELGAEVSANIHYVHELSDKFWSGLLGFERASQMTRLGSLARRGVRFALHSDFIAAPALPLHNAWVAVNRLSESDHALCPDERITVDQAMRAITIDAAHILGRADDIGSIRCGKRPTSRCWRATRTRSLRGSCAT